MKRIFFINDPLGYTSPAAAFPRPGLIMASIVRILPVFSGDVASDTTNSFIKLYPIFRDPSRKRKKTYGSTSGRAYFSRKA
jgi:hypothetical protein